MANEVIELKQERTIDLAVNLSDRAIQAMAEQRAALKQFVQSQLREGLDGDYAKIPGTPKKTLLKPGAEKLANIFQLGSRIVKVEREIDPITKYAMFTYTIEVFHIPTGKAVGQCEGSANTMESKQKNKDFGFLVNSLGKIAQKRAFVGAVISATGASDFFTQDMEDADPNSFDNRPEPKRAQASVPKATAAASTNVAQNAEDYVIPFGRTKGKRLGDLDEEALENLHEWVNSLDNPRGAALQCKQAVERYLDERLAVK